MALKADFILSLMELIVGGKDGLQPVERTVIDRCVRQMYREHLQNPETAKMPTLQTLYDLLCSQPEGEAVRLATALEIYVSGSLNVLFSPLACLPVLSCCFLIGCRQRTVPIVFSVSKNFDTLLKNASIFSRGCRPLRALAFARTLEAWEVCFPTYTPPENTI